MSRGQRSASSTVTAAWSTSDSTRIARRASSTWGSLSAQTAATTVTPRSDPMTPGNDIPPVEPGTKPGPLF